MTMNKSRLQKIDRAVALLRDVLGEEREAYEAASERWQESEKGENSDEWQDAIAEAIDALESAERL